jgi:hypothetical protein
MPGIVIGKAAFTATSGGAGGDGPAISVATRSSVHKQGADTLDTAGYTGHHRMEVTADSASDLVIPYGFWHWMVHPLAAGNLLIDATLVMPDGTIIPITFDGESTLDVTLDGTTLQRFDSDVIPETVTRGELVAVRTWARAASGTCELGVSWYSDTGTASWYQSGNHINDAENPPVVGGPGPYNNTYYAHPLGLFAQNVTQADGVSFLTWGDSNMANSDGFSYHERAMAKRFPYYRCCSAGAALASAASANVQDLARGYDYADIAMGTNNLGQDVATNLPLLQDAVANFRAQGVENILVCTLPPSTISSDGWTTVAGQTPFDGSPSQWQNHRDLNDALRDGESGADAVYDAASYVEVNGSGVFTINGGRWAVKAAPGEPVAGTYGTGPHYEYRGHAAAAVGLDAALERLLGGETGFVQVNPDLGT